GSLAKMLRPYLDYLKIEESLANAEAMAADESTDAEMRALAQEEIAELKPRHQALHERLEDVLLGSGEDYGSIIVEIRAGTGGDEAAIFAGDLYEMYGRYARTQ